MNDYTCAVLALDDLGPDASTVESELVALGFERDDNAPSTGPRHVFVIDQAGFDTSTALEDVLDARYLAYRYSQDALADLTATVILHDPELGSFVAPCTGSGQVVVAAGPLRRLADRLERGEIDVAHAVAELRDLSGQRWVERLGRVATYRG